jgi:putative tryptophan/tyrosine transport system substrate-binding protein
MNFDRLKRREFITLLGGAASWPFAARAQQPAMPVIGVLGSASAEQFASRLLAFRQGLSESGYVEGHNVAMEFRWAYDQYDRLPGLAADLVSRRVALIAAFGNQVPALAAKAATLTIPIVFAMGADPLQSGLVASLNRPGGNITGITILAGVLVSKRLQLLHELVPNAQVIGLLGNPTNPSEINTILRDAQDAARAFGVTIEVVNVRTEADFGAAFASLAQKRITALSVLPDTLFSARPEQLIALAERHAMPTIYYAKEFAKAGGLMTYGADLVASYRQAGIYAGRVLKGEKPADLPVIQPTKFELVMNLKTARALSLQVPDKLLALADEVIE